MDLDTRATEIATFLSRDKKEIQDLLSEGFIVNHHRVAEDFRQANPQTDNDLLEWYRNTDSYIFELSAYHLDPGFNYSGMCEGVADHLRYLEKRRVLCLGDGVGDLSRVLWERGLLPTYHDLEGSKTAQFAKFMLVENTNNVPTLLTGDWVPKFRANSYDAIVALDFFEHLTEVELWARECFKTLRKGGQFMAQNAFAIGDNEHGGSIPMHLTRNNRFEFDWIPLLESIGFINQNNGWWIK